MLVQKIRVYNVDEIATRTILDRISELKQAAGIAEPIHFMVRHLHSGSTHHLTNTNIINR